MAPTVLRSRRSSSCTTKTATPSSPAAAAASTASPTCRARRSASPMDGGSRELEFERIRTVLRENIVTVDVKRDGLGGITRERFDTSLEQIAADYKFRQHPAPQDIFDDAFLPPPTSRKID